jgi:oligoribonuclease NrnB/cAMP/cGMP phosphodiesterase (DHH superfamily)
MDGIAAASIVKMNHPGTEFLGCQYGEELPLVKDYDIVFIVDFSFKKEAMETLIKENSNVVWIDHHKTAMENNPDLWADMSIDGIRSLHKAGGELTWEWFHPTIKPPLPILLLGDRDMWKFKYDNTKPFYETTSMEFKKPDVNLLSDGIVTDFVNKGKILLKKKQRQVKAAYAQGSTVMFHGHKTRIVNSINNSSDIGAYCYEYERFPIALIWSIRNGKVVCGLRSNTIDVGAIAKTYGGGGHKFASGFQTTIEHIKELYNTIEKEEILKEGIL